MRVRAQVGVAVVGVIALAGCVQTHVTTPKDIEQKRRLEALSRVLDTYEVPNGFTKDQIDYDGTLGSAGCVAALEKLDPTAKLPDIDACTKGLGPKRSRRLIQSGDVLATCDLAQVSGGWTGLELRAPRWSSFARDAESKEICGFTGTKGGTKYDVAVLASLDPRREHSLIVISAGDPD